jgi:uncharacterized protein (TIGR00645 family)
MTGIERAIETIIFSSRWLAAPFVVGLILGLVGLLCKFLVKLAEFLWHLKDIPSVDALISVLGLVDLTLTANLILIVIFSTYENFVRPLRSAQPEMPDGLVRIGFSLLKQKLLGSIVAISAVHVLERYMDIEHQPDVFTLALLVGAMLAFALAMLIVAAADRVSESGGHRDH